MPFVKVTQTMPEKSQLAWQRHLATLDDARAAWLNSPWASTDLERGRALFQVLTMEHAGFHLFLSPRHLFPYFTTDVFHHPTAYTWGLCCPDFFYRHTFVDGARTYQIKAHPGTRRWTEFHVQSEFWGDPSFRTVGSWDLADFQPAADGSIDIMLSPDPHEGNWIQLDPQEHYCMIVLRDALYDWNRDQPTRVQIEALGRTGQEPAHVAEGDLDARLEKLDNFIHAAARHWIGRNSQIVAAAGFNHFWEGAEKSLGGIQHASYLFMVYEIGPEDALIIETQVPNSSRFWAVQLADLCYQTLEYMDHQSSLNAFQTTIDPDGNARFVLSLQDPGVPNWLDPVGNPRGVTAWRWVKTDIAPMPSVKKVALAELQRHLHPQTQRVSPAQRRGVLAKRREGIRRLYDM